MNISPSYINNKHLTDKVETVEQHIEKVHPSTPDLSNDDNCSFLTRIKDSNYKSVLQMYLQQYFKAETKKILNYRSVVVNKRPLNDSDKKEQNILLYRSRVTFTMGHLKNIFFDGEACKSKVFADQSAAKCFMMTSLFNNILTSLK